MTLSRLIFIGVLLLLSSQGYATEPPVGIASKAIGTPSVLRTNAEVSLKQNDVIFWKDELRTGQDTRLYITFEDGTLLQLGDHSNLIIDELVYEPTKPGNAAFTLTKGVFRMVSGALNKMNGSQFIVNTPLATIGVRGTDFWGHQTEDKLIMALLDNGRLEIASADKVTILTEPLSAIVIEKGKAAGTVIKLSEEQVAQARKTIE